MATGLPVVSTNVGSIDELVVEGETGFLTPPGDPQSLADKIAFLLDNPDVARELGQAGRRRVEEHFSKETMVRSFEDLFERLVLEREARKG
jgi:glycosyltransferase involved in cell wall biosynthesis